MMTSTKSNDFLSELKATLSKLTARNEPDIAQNVTVCAEHTPEMTVDRSHYHCDSDHHLESSRETASVCRRSVLYGELSSVLEKRGQQQLNDESRVINLESRLKPGKSIVYLGSGHRRDSLATDTVTVIVASQNTSVTEHQQADSDMTSSRSNNTHQTVADVVGCSDEDNNSTTSTSSAGATISQMCPSSHHGNQDSACVMSADESAESTDCSLLRIHEQQQQQQQKRDRDKCCESVVVAQSDRQQLTLSSDDGRRRHHRQHFATFPLIRRTPTLTCRHASTAAVAADDDNDDNDDDGRLVPCSHDDVITTLMITHSGEPISVGLSHQEHVIDRPLSVPVTVPEPTSFHQDGSQIRQQLLDHHRLASVQRPQQDVSMMHEYERRSHRARRRRRRHLRHTVVQDSATSDSEIISQPTFGRNWRLSPSPVFHLLHQASYCVNSHKDAQRLQLNSPSSLLIDSSVDTDSQTFCQVLICTVFQKSKTSNSRR